MSGGHPCGKIITIEILFVLIAFSSFYLFIFFFCCSLFLSIWRSRMKKLDGEASWVFDLIDNLLRSQLYIGPIQTFVDENCYCFAQEEEDWSSSGGEQLIDEREGKLFQTEVHNVRNHFINSNPRLREKKKQQGQTPPPHTHTH